MDYDNDRRIDLIRSQNSGDLNQTMIWRNTGSAFVTDDLVDSIGLGFEADTLELNDINGDGLLDAVNVADTEVRYRLNLGWVTGTVRVEYSDLAATVLSDLAPVTVLGSTVEPNGGGFINAADAWIAFAGGEGILELDGGPTASSIDHLLSSSARQGLLGGDERVTFLHRDSTDNVVAVSDSDGNVVEQTHRYPFGSTRWSSCSSQESRGFTGDRTEPGTDHVWIGVRHYDPLLGRWLSPDPLYSAIDGQAATENPWEAMGTYVYGWNSPLSGQDDSGENWQDNRRQRRAVLNFLKHALPVLVSDRPIGINLGGGGYAKFREHNQQNLGGGIIARFGLSMPGSGAIPGELSAIVGFLQANQSDMFAFISSEPSLGEEHGLALADLLMDPKVQDRLVTESVAVSIASGSRVESAVEGGAALAARFTNPLDSGFAALSREISTVRRGVTLGKGIRGGTIAPETARGGSSSPPTRQRSVTVFHGD